jgi:peroxiredoxin
VLKVGDVAPPFEATQTSGDSVSLAAMRGTPLILYFFPAAFTPNCTIEIKGFRDNYPELKELGFMVIGVSTDSHETQCRFASKHGVSYPMIADDDLVISRAYGVLWPLIPYARRIAYVLDDRHIVRAVFRHEFQVNRHLDEVMHFVRDFVQKKPVS